MGHEILTGTGRRLEIRFHQTGVELAEIQHGRQWGKHGGCRVPRAGEPVLNHPSIGGGLAGALVGDAAPDAVTVADSEEKWGRNGLVDGAEHGLTEFGSLGRQREDLNLVNAGTRREVDGLGGELVAPDDGLDLLHEAGAHGLGRLGVVVDARLGDGAIKGGLLGEGEHAEGAPIRPRAPAVAP